jgi:hypothetical protein
MKTTTLMAVALFITGTVAAFTPADNERRGNVLFNNNRPIEFVERGILFLVFPDGQFDFSTQPSAGGAYYRGTRVNATYGIANLGGTKVEHDAQGRVRRVGNVMINYDATNRVKRIGTVYMTYHRNLLSQIGGMTLKYDRNGRLTDVRGTVNGTQAVAYTYPPNSYSYYGPTTYYGPTSNNGWSSDYYFRESVKK